MKDRLKRILIVGAAGVVGGFFLGILWRQYFGIVGVVVGAPLVSGLVGLSFGIASELTRKRNELIRVIVRTLSCWGLLFLLFWLFYFLENLFNFFRGPIIEGEGFTGYLAGIIYMCKPIFNSVVFGVSLGEGLLKRKSVAIRIIGGVVSGALCCGLWVYFLGFLIAKEYIYQGYIYGVPLAFGLIVGVVISDRVGKKKKPEVQVG